MKNKYLIISPYFPSEVSHAGSYIYDQVKALKKKSNYDIHVVKLVTSHSREIDYTYKDINVLTFKVLDIPFFIFPSIFSKINNYRFNLFLIKNKLDKNIKYVHAHVCYPGAYLANHIAKCYSAKSIIQHHGIDALQLLNCRFKFIRKIQKSFLIRNSIKQLNTINLNIYVSNRVRMSLRKYHSFKPNDEFILYNGVDKNKFYKTNITTNTDYFVIGCIANFLKIKDHIALIKAIELIINENIYNIRLRLIGSGLELDNCKNYVNEKKLSKYISFESEVAHEDLNVFYNSINLFVLPSYFEASACVLMEAWATNTPIISIKNQGISELIPEHEYNNLLADPKSPSSLKEKILNEYNKKRDYDFDNKFNILNTINDYLNYSFFKQ